MKRKIAAFGLSAAMALSLVACDASDPVDDLGDPVIDDSIADTLPPVTDSMVDDSMVDTTN